MDEFMTWDDVAEWTTTEMVFKYDFIKTAPYGWVNVVDIIPQDDGWTKFRVWSPSYDHRTVVSKGDLIVIRDGTWTCVNCGRMPIICVKEYKGIHENGEWTAVDLCTKCAELFDIKVGAMNVDAESYSEDDGGAYDESDNPSNGWRQPN